MARDPVARVYDRVARFYDLYDTPMDWLGGARRRRRVLSQAQGRVLEVGIGTGRNTEHYPAGVRVTGIDLSGAMLGRARQRIERSGVVDSLVQGDAQRLPYPDATFDTVTATCVFCSVADPVAGLREVRRVVKPAGQVLLLEHVRPRNRAWLAVRCAEPADPAPVRTEHQPQDGRQRRRRRPAYHRGPARGDLAGDQSRVNRLTRCSSRQRTRHGSEQKTTSVWPSSAVWLLPSGTGMPHIGSICPGRGGLPCTR